MEDNIQISIAGEDWERNAVYRLRYGQVGNQQNNLAPEGSELYYDLQDSEGSVLFIAKSIEDEVVGSLSLVRRRDGPFILDEEYQWEKLAVYCHSSYEAVIANTCLVTRVVVHQQCRGKGIFKMLRRSLDNRAAEEGCRYLVWVVLNSIDSAHTAPQKRKDWPASYGYQLYQQRIVGEMNAGFWVRDLLDA